MNKLMLVTCTLPRHPMRHVLTSVKGEGKGLWGYDDEFVFTRDREELVVINVADVHAFEVMAEGKVYVFGDAHRALYDTIYDRLSKF